MQALKDLFNSKRAIVLVASFVSGIAAKKGLDIDPAALAVLMSGCVAYILGQSYVEANKPAPPAPDPAAK